MWVLNRQKIKENKRIKKLVYSPLRPDCLFERNDHVVIVMYQSFKTIYLVYFEKSGHVDHYERRVFPTS